MTDPTPLNVKEIQDKIKERFTANLIADVWNIDRGLAQRISNNLLGEVLFTVTVQEFAALKAAYGQEE